MNSPKIYIIILNWNGWKDTIECLESVFRIEHINFCVIVCDNNSTNDSLNYIQSWADGNLDVYMPRAEQHRQLSFPPLNKPIPYTVYNREQAERGGDTHKEESNLILIQTGKNLGFAGGNNVGTRYVLARDNFSYIWFLNNDTVIEATALDALVNRMHERPDAGICGSLLLYYENPNIVQALGGAMFNQWLATTRHIGIGSDKSTLFDQVAVEKAAQYIVGASMLVSRNFIQKVGLMDEDFFLYFEEIDWAIRGKKHFNLAYAHDSVVHHKEGGSIGTSCDPMKQSVTAEYYGVRNRLRITSKHNFLLLPFVYISLLGVILNRVRRNQWTRALMVLKIMLGIPSKAISNN